MSVPIELKCLYIHKVLPLNPCDWLPMEWLPVGCMVSAGAMCCAVRRDVAPPPRLLARGGLRGLWASARRLPGVARGRGAGPEPPLGRDGEKGYAKISPRDLGLLRPSLPPHVRPGEAPGNRRREVTGGQPKERSHGRAAEGEKSRAGSRRREVTGGQPKERSHGRAAEGEKPRAGSRRREVTGGQPKERSRQLASIEHFHVPALCWLGCGGGGRPCSTCSRPLPSPLPAP